MRLYNPRLVYFYQALLLLVLSVGLAWTANEVRPNSLPWLNTGPQPATMDDGFEATPELDVAEAMRLHAEGLAVFIDARHQADYDDGHIPGAVHVPLGLFEDEIEAKLAPYGKDSKFVVYCSSITCGMAQELALALGFMEYPDVSVFAEGMEGWTGAGGEIESLIQGGEAMTPAAATDGQSAAMGTEEAAPADGGQAQTVPEEAQTQHEDDGAQTKPESGEVAQ